MHWELSILALARLAVLVACDTRNPPRGPGVGNALDVVRAVLGRGFSFEETDLGDGCVCLLAVRGSPRLLFNCHLDTVPPGEGWTRDPLALDVHDGRAVGLGACDVKGAAAALLAAAALTTGPAALLFTTDEEHGTSRCVRSFLEGRPSFDAVVVAEPTGCRAVSAHRGVVSVAGTFAGTPGHASRAEAGASALHHAVRWGAAALAAAGEHEAAGGVRFNLGRVEGGTKANVVAASAEVVWGARPPPEIPLEPLVESLQASAPDPARVRWERRFTGPALPARPEDLDAAGRLAADLRLPPGPPVDFWTEAALFSEAGYPALVYGPGDIAQAHAPDEWVAREQLGQAVEAYTRLLDGGTK